ncbi:hypothetical protein B711_0764 [Chlamydia psittaci CP3]|nr:hypothetical protein B711_0764 [Chlamydia psittaci CP3]
MKKQEKTRLFPLFQRLFILVIFLCPFSAFFSVFPFSKKKFVSCSSWRLRSL